MPEPKYAMDVDRQTYQSEALQVLSACVEAGCIGGYAAYVHACDVAGLTAIIPETSTDASGGHWTSTQRPDLTAPDIEYLSYWAKRRPASLVQETPNILRDPGMQALFTNVLERLLFNHQIESAGGQGALGDLQRMARVFKDSAGRYSVPQGTYTAHVLASLHNVALQAHMAFDDFGRYADEYTPRGVMVGVKRYIEYLDAQATRIIATCQDKRIAALLTAQHDKLTAIRRHLVYWQRQRRTATKQIAADVAARVAVINGVYTVVVPARKSEACSERQARTRARHTAKHRLK